MASGFDLADLTTVAYFGVDVASSGAIVESGAGWVGYESQDLANLITAAHAYGDRVLLSAECFSQSALDYMTHNVATVAPVLVGSLASAMEAKRFDGVNLDFEGLGSADRAGFASLVTAVASGLRAIDPAWEITVDTYGSSATDPSGFFDVPALASVVNQIFVMAYDMQDDSVPSPTAPLVGGGYNDTVVAASYAAVAPPSKVILGVPFYGYEWPTASGTLGAVATGKPTPVSYAQIMAGHHPLYWDPRTMSAWTSFQVGNQWYEAYFDDPTTLALKADLASHYGLGGVGIWALGMDGNDPAMVKALLGEAPPLKDLLLGPAGSLAAALANGSLSASAPGASAPGSPGEGGSGAGGHSTSTAAGSSGEAGGSSAARGGSTAHRPGPAIPSTTVPTVPSRGSSPLPPLLTTSSGGSKPLVSDSPGSSGRSGSSESCPSSTSSGSKGSGSGGSSPSSGGSAANPSASGKTATASPSSTSSASNTSNSSACTTDDSSSPSAASSAPSGSGQLAFFGL
jgi:hypothetical protein